MNENSSSRLWVRTFELFHEALERPARKRPAYLDEACGDDQTLRRSVERLLDAHHRRGGVLSSPSDIVGAVADRGEERSSPPFAAGDRLGDRFEIVVLLGRGGMGWVYQARDLRLDLDVALKVLRDDLARNETTHERFRREIALARRVTHPNACRIFDFFEHAERDVRQGGGEGQGPTGHAVPFITMELLRGETLAGRLRRGVMSTSEARPILEQVAAGLAAAHDGGIVHRDLKPTNVMLVPEGDGLRAVVMDFGIATSLTPLDADLRETRPGQLVGSPASMAPEQLTGAPVSPATDVYAFGLLAYEMVTGHLPFRGDSALEVAVRRLHEPPTPPTAHVTGLDPRWVRTIERCLKRDPAARFQRPQDAVASFDAVIAAERGRPGLAAFIAAALLILPLSDVRRGAVADDADAPEVRKVAVLPFHVQAPEEFRPWLPGVHWPVIAALDELPGAADVVVRGVEAESDGRPAEDLARELGAVAVLTGTVDVEVGERVTLAEGARRAEQLVVTARLSDARSGEQLWTGRTGGPLGEDAVGRAAETLALHVVVHVAPVGGGEICAADPGAHADVARARYLWERGGWLPHWHAKRYVESALERDPSCAHAQAFQARLYVRYGFNQSLTMHEACETALPAARAAARLAPDDVESQLVAGQALFFCEWDLEGAEAALARVLEVEPDHRDAGKLMVGVLRTARRHEEAVALGREAWARHPDDDQRGAELAQTLLLAGEPDDAAEIYGRLAAAQPEGSPDARRFAVARFGCLVAADRVEEARELRRELCAASEACAGEVDWGLYLAPSLDPPVEMHGPMPWGRDRVAWQLAHGRHDDAVATLAETLREAPRHPSILFWCCDPRLDKLRDDPRFQDLLDRTGLWD